MKKIILAAAVAVPAIVGVGIAKKKSTNNIKTLCDIKYTGNTIVGINALPTEKTEWTETYKVASWDSANPNVDEDSYKWESSYIVKESHRLILPKGFKNIGDKAFKNLPITEIFIPEGIKIIGAEAFSGTNIESLNIPSSVETIEDGAFRNCQSLKEVTFSDKSRLKTIGKKAFDKCVILREISLPPTVTTVGENAFHSCRCLKSFSINNVGRKVPCDILQDERGFIPLSDCMNLTFLDLRGVRSIKTGSLNDILFNNSGTLLLSKSTEINKKYRTMLLSTQWKIKIE